MKTSGLYIVSLNNVEPISVNANDPRIADRCIKVNRENCKFGKATNLEYRRRNYEKVFGRENVNFWAIAALEAISAAEKAVLARLSEHRMRGHSGRKNEWLEGIVPAELEVLILSTLTDNGFVFVRLESISTAR